MSRIVDQQAIERGETVVKLMLITPETAERWLERNTSNRNIRPAHVAGLASDMAAGLWQITGEAIKFDVDGRLIDGQHRLTAIADSRVAVQMLVVSGLRPEAQQVMDSGAKRQASDALKFSGHSNTSVLAAAARLALSQEQGRFTSPVSAPLNTTHSQITQFVDLNPDLLEAVEETTGWRIVGVSHAAAAAAQLRLRRIDEPAAKQFIADLIECNAGGRGDPRSALIRRLQAAKRDREHLGRPAEMWCIFRAWNAQRDRESLKLIKFTPSYAWVEPK